MPLAEIWIAKIEFPHQAPPVIAIVAAGDIGFVKADDRLGGKFEDCIPGKAVDFGEDLLHMHPVICPRGEIAVLFRLDEGHRPHFIP